ncbi:hypothetical protein DM01DRAFT_1331389 [Hesseltinella vesiculosa]|uniref:Uncharacterized protein n=1 Tax=Hesseltinella vesiculosa TaxID=101127 RepID=A0A1X2GV45_9FUNG|nr:hypothetical protein DM01DRAFT_1331389 [Hesseltinella vesiculosa]
MFIPEALVHNHLTSVSAVLLRTTNDQGIYHIVNFLYRYPFIKEITIYNLVPTPLDPNAFQRPNPSLIHPVSLHLYDAPPESDQDGLTSLFSSCALSTFTICYIQDDRAFNLFMDSLYYHAQRYPDWIHANTRTEEYLMHRRWQLDYNDESVPIHTGFANVRHGAMIPRSRAQQFVNQLSVKVLPFYQRQKADALFALWSNSNPVLLSNPLPMTATNPLALQTMKEGVDLLATALKQHLPYFAPHDKDNSLQDRDVRTSCGNDKCLFVTNIDPFPTSLPYDPEQQVSNSSLGSVQLWRDEKGAHLPSPEFWIYRGYHAAVDSHTGTCWNTFREPGPGDYFGLDLIGNMHMQRLVIYSRQEVDADLFQLTANHYDEWNDCDLTMDADQSIERRAVFNVQCPVGYPASAIRIFFRKQMTMPFDLCGLSIDNFNL